MHRTELSFRALHERLVWLEDRQVGHGPSDEQVERVLRKILAERFSGEDQHPVQDPNITKEEVYFVENRKRLAILSPVVIDPASLFVEPDAVPSKAYADTFEMLERHLTDFPNINRKTTSQGTVDHGTSYDARESRGSDSS
jgi:hypothetical protein